MGSQSQAPPVAVDLQAATLPAAVVAGNQFQVLSLPG
jgi:hypothetical protein